NRRWLRSPRGQRTSAEKTFLAQHPADSALEPTCSICYLFRVPCLGRTSPRAHTAKPIVHMTRPGRSPIGNGLSSLVIRRSVIAFPSPGMVNMRRVFPIALFLVYLVLSAFTFAQTSNSTLGGTVSDSKGARLPGVSIAAANTRTGIVTTVLSNE